MSTESKIAPEASINLHSVYKEMRLLLQRANLKFYNVEDAKIVIDIGDCGPCRDPSCKKAIVVGQQWVEGTITLIHLCFWWIGC